jgi:carboxyl-terminal processing protease
MRRSVVLLTLVFLPVLGATQFATAQDVPKWFLGGSIPSDYTMTCSGSPTSHAGATLSLRSVSTTASGFGVVGTAMSADTLAGRRVRISGDIETKDVSASASLWLRADSGGKMLVLDNGMDQGIKGTTTGPKHMDITVYVPNSATTLVFGLLLSGAGEATARDVRIVEGPVVAANTPLAPDAQRELDSAFTIVRWGSLWRDTVTWSRVEADVRAIAAGSESAADTYPAIRALLARLGDHHSFLMKPQAATAFRAGGAENPRPLVRVQTDAIGYISVPAYGGADKAAAESYVRGVHDSLALAVRSGAGTCRWVLDLRTNGGGNMWPMLGGLRPFVGEAGLGSFVSAGGSTPLWHALDQVDLKPPVTLAPLETANVALLTGPRTASSGEAVAISFIGRPHTRSFGLPTAGLSTANSTMMLPDGAMILLTTSVEADRTGKRYGERLAPDETIPVASAGATTDPQLDRAVAWLKSQSCA